MCVRENEARERERESLWERDSRGEGPKKLMSLDFGEHAVDDVKMDVNGTSTSVEFHQHNQQV